MTPGRNRYEAPDSLSKPIVESNDTPAKQYTVYSGAILNLQVGYLITCQGSYQYLFVTYYRIY